MWARIQIWWTDTQDRRLKVEFALALAVVLAASLR
jgi:hypothetical protein